MCTFEFSALLWVILLFCIVIVQYVGSSNYLERDHVCIFEIFFFFQVFCSHSFFLLAGVYQFCLHSANLCLHSTDLCLSWLLTRIFYSVLQSADHCCCMCMRVVRGFSGFVLSNNTPSLQIASKPSIPVIYTTITFLFLKVPWRSCCFGWLHRRFRFLIFSI